MSDEEQEQSKIEAENDNSKDIDAQIEQNLGDKLEEQLGDKLKEMDTQQQEEDNQIEINLSQDVLDQIEQLNQNVDQKSNEELLEIRRHQLSLAKILVSIHGKNESYLIRGHFQLGEAYLNYKCEEQAIDHLTKALQKNGQMFDKNVSAQENHINILTLLGKCYLELGNFDDALELLMKAYDMAKGVFEENDNSCAGILTLVSSCFVKKRNYDQALKYIKQVLDITIKNLSFKTKSTALVFQEMAKIYQKQEDLANAIDMQTQCIQIFEEIEQDDFLQISDLYSTLSQYQEKNEDYEGYLNSLQKIRGYYKDIYGKEDKKTIKYKRMISLALLKQNKNEEALSELLETEISEKRIYGEYSLQVAKTQKIIGTLYLVKNMFLESKSYLNKAKKVFQATKYKKAVFEIDKKLRILKNMKEREQYEQDVEQDVDGLGEEEMV